MPIANNDLLPLDRRDANNIGQIAAAPILGTVANTVNVVQLAARTTGVTINSAVGTITLVSAAGTTVAAAFTVTNSQVAAQDVVVASVQTGTDARFVYVTATATGSFVINTATLGGTTTESPIINFVVIKSAII